MNTPREPLSTEERALADALARGPGPHQPGPSLDARILAAARAAVDTSNAQATPVQPVTVSPPTARSAIAPPGAMRQVRTGATRRWSLGLGVAASLMIAVTIAWQLRPQQTTQRVYESAQAPAADAAPSVSAQDQMAPAAPAPSRPLPPAPAAPEISARPAPMASPPAPGMVAPAPAPAARREQAPHVEEVAPPRPDLPAAEPPQLQRVQTYTPPVPSAPPAPVQALAVPAPPPPVAAAESDTFEARPTAATRAQPAQSKRADQEGAPAAMAQRQSAKEATLANDASPAIPPQIPRPRADRAVARSPAAAVRSQIAQDRRLPPAQWLQNIRRHRFEGDSGLARASLQAFRQAHPDMTIPEDLRPLLP
jgi:hypothetical protein